MDPVDSARRLTSIPAMNILTSERAGLSTVDGGMTRMTPPRFKRFIMQNALQQKL
tara:strand:- start:14 stop:178 length:165 start_codon:yes stop_codon:yes gene_type:complete